MQLRKIVNLLMTKSMSSTSILPFDAIPGPKPLPLVGNIWRYFPLIGDYNIDTIHENAQFNKKQYGPIVREQITRNHAVLHLFDCNDIEAFFRQDGLEPCRRSHRALLKLRHSNPSRYNDGGIFPENGSNWSRLRGLFHQHLMKKSTVQLRTKIIDEITRETLHQLDNEQSFVRIDDFEKFLNRWSLRCGLSIFLDYSNSDMPDEFVLDKIITCSDNQLDALAGTEIRSERWVKSPQKCPYYKKIHEIEDFMYVFVDERIDYLIKTNKNREVSFVRDWLVDSKLDRKDVITFIIDCVLADIHTTVYTSTFLLEDISKRLNLKLKYELLREISHTLPSSTQAIVQSDFIDKLPLLKDCLKETLRLHPVSIGTGRVTQHEMLIRNFRIPKNVMVIAHNQSLSRDPNVYEDADDYKPDRWSLYKSLPRLDRPSPFAWLPFGFGARACLGQRVVNIQISVLAARLLQKYELKFMNELKTKTTLLHRFHGKTVVELVSSKK